MTALVYRLAYSAKPEEQVVYRLPRFLDVQRRITQERVPTASNAGSRDVTSAAHLQRNDTTSICETIH
jgi:hypothetical protein